MSLIDETQSTIVDPGHEILRPNMAGDDGAARLNLESHGGTVAVPIPRLLPTQVFERTRWQRRYATKLQLTDCLVVCAAVALAQYVRFGSTLEPGRLKY